MHFLLLGLCGNRVKKNGFQLEKKTTCGNVFLQETQFSRGGGTVCLKSPDLWKYYRNSVNDMEPCPRKKVGLFGKFKHWLGSKFA